MLKTICSTFLIIAFCCLFAHTCPAESQDKVLATVGSEEITEQDLMDMLSNLPPHVQSQYERGKPRKELLRDVIDRKLFAAAARRMNLDQDQKVKREIKKQVEMILAAEYRKRITAGAKVNEGDTREYYQQHPELYNTPEMVKLSHIVVKSEDDAREAMMSLKGGADFAEVAKEKTIYAKERGGDLGWVTTGMVLPEIEEVAFKLEAGKISDIIRTKDEFHIIRVEEKKEEASIPISEAKGDINRKLYGEKVKKATEEARNRLSKELGVHIF